MGKPNSNNLLYNIKSRFTIDDLMTQYNIKKESKSLSDTTCSRENHLATTRLTSISEQTLKLILKLLSYFSSNPKSEYQELDLQEIKEILSESENKKIVSINKVKIALDQIRENNIFIIKEGIWRERKTFSFYLPKENINNFKNI